MDVAELQRKLTSSEQSVRNLTTDNAKLKRELDISRRTRIYGNMRGAGARALSNTLAELDDVKRQLFDKDSEVGTLKTSLHSLEGYQAKVKQLMFESMNTERALADTLKRYEDHQIENHELQMSYHTLLEETKTKAPNVATAAQMKDLERKLEAKKEEVQNAEEQLEKLMKKVYTTQNEKDEEIARLKQSAGGPELAKGLSRMNVLSKWKAAAHGSRVKDLNTQLAEKTAALEVSESRLSDLRARLSAATRGEHVQFSEETYSLMVEKYTLEYKLKALENVEVQNVQLQADTQSAEQRAKRFEESLRVMENSLDKESGGAARRLTLGLKVQINELEKTNKFWKGQYAIANAQILKLKREVGALTAAKSVATQVHMAEIERLTTLTTTTFKMTSSQQTTAILSERRELESRLGSLVTQLAAVNASLAEERSKTVDLKETLKKTEMRVVVEAEKATRAETRYQRALRTENIPDELAALRADLADSEKRHDELRVEHAGTEGRLQAVTDLNIHLEGIENECLAAKLHVNRLEAASQDAIQRRRRTLPVAPGRGDPSGDTQGNDHAADSPALLPGQLQPMEHVDLSTKSTAELHSMIKTLVQRNSTLIHEVSSYRHQTKEASSLLSSLKAHESSMQREHSSKASEHVARLELMREQVDKLTRRLEAAESKTESEQLRLAQEERQVSDSRLHELQQEHVELKSTIQKQLQEIDDKKLMLSQKMSENEVLRGRLAEHEHTSLIEDLDLSHNGGGMRGPHSPSPMKGPGSPSPLKGPDSPTPLKGLPLSTSQRLLGLTDPKLSASTSSLNSLSQYGGPLAVDHETLRAQKANLQERNDALSVQNAVLHTRVELLEDHVARGEGDSMKLFAEETKNNRLLAVLDQVRSTLSQPELGTNPNVAAALQIIEQADVPAHSEALEALRVQNKALSNELRDVKINNAEELAKANAYLERAQANVLVLEAARHNRLLGSTSSALKDAQSVKETERDVQDAERDLFVAEIQKQASDIAAKQAKLRKELESSVQQLANKEGQLAALEDQVRARDKRVSASVRPRTDPKTLLDTEAERDEVEKKYHALLVENTELHAHVAFLSRQLDSLASIESEVLTLRSRLHRYERYASEHPEAGSLLGAMPQPDYVGQLALLNKKTVQEKEDAALRVARLEGKLAAARDRAERLETRCLAQKRDVPVTEQLAQAEKERGALEVENGDLLHRVEALVEENHHSQQHLDEVMQHSSAKDAEVDALRKENERLQDRLRRWVSSGRPSADESFGSTQDDRLDLSLPEGVSDERLQAEKEFADTLLLECGEMDSRILDLETENSQLKTRVQSLTEKHAALLPVQEELNYARSSIARLNEKNPGLLPVWAEDGPSQPFASNPKLGSATRLPSVSLTETSPRPSTQQGANQGLPQRVSADSPVPRGHGSRDRQAVRHHSSQDGDLSFASNNTSNLSQTVDVEDSGLELTMLSARRDAELQACGEQIGRLVRRVDLATRHDPADTPHALENEVNVANKRYELALGKNRDLIDDLAKTRRESVRANETVGVLNGQIEAQAQQIARLQARLEKLAAPISSKQDQIAILQNELEDLDTRYMRATLENGALRGRLEPMEKFFPLLSSLEHKLSTCESRLAYHESLQEPVSQDVEMEATRLVELPDEERHIALLRVLNERQRLEEARDEALGQREFLKEELNQEKVQASESRGKLEAEIDFLHEKLDRTGLHQSILVSSPSDAVQHVAALEDKVTAAQDRVESSKKEVAELKAQVHALQKEKLDYAEYVGKKDAELAALRSKLEVQTKKAEGPVRALSVPEKVASLEAERDLLSSQAQDLAIENGGLVARLEALAAQHDNCLALNEEVVTLRLRLLRAEKMADPVVTSEELKQLENELLQVKGKDSEVSTLWQQFYSLQRQVGALQAVETELTSDNLAMRQKNIRLETKSNELEAVSHVEVNMLKEKIAMKSLDAKASPDLQRSQASQLTDINHELQSTLLSTRGVLNKTEKECADLKEKHAAMAAELRARDMLIASMQKKADLAELSTPSAPLLTRSVETLAVDPENLAHSSSLPPPAAPKPTSTPSPSRPSGTHRFTLVMPKPPPTDIISSFQSNEAELMAENLNLVVENGALKANVASKDEKLASLSGAENKLLAAETKCRQLEYELSHTKQALANLATLDAAPVVHEKDVPRSSSSPQPAFARMTSDKLVENASLRETNVALKTDNAALTQELAETKKQQVEMAEADSIKFARLKAEREHYQDKAVRLQSRLDLLLRKAPEPEIVQALKAENEKLAEQHLSLKQEHALCAKGASSPDSPLGSLDAQLKQAHDEIQGLRSALDKKEMAPLKEDAAPPLSKDAEINALKREIMAKDGELEALRKTTALSREGLPSSGPKASQPDVEALHKQLYTKDGEIAALRRDLDGMRAKDADQGKLLWDKDREIAALKDEIARLKAEIDRLRALKTPVEQGAMTGTSLNPSLVKGPTPSSGNKAMIDWDDDSAPHEKVAKRDGKTTGSVLREQAPLGGSIVDDDEDSPLLASSPGHRRSTAKPDLLRWNTPAPQERVSRRKSSRLETGAGFGADKLMKGGVIDEGDDVDVPFSNGGLRRKSVNRGSGKRRQSVDSPDVGYLRDSFAIPYGGEGIMPYDSSQTLGRPEGSNLPRSDLPSSSRLLGHQSTLDPLRNGNGGYPSQPSSNPTVSSNIFPSNGVPTQQHQFPSFGGLPNHSSSTPNGFPLGTNRGPPFPSQQQPFIPSQYPPTSSIPNGQPFGDPYNASAPNPSQPSSIHPLLPGQPMAPSSSSSSKPRTNPLIPTPSPDHPIPVNVLYPYDPYLSTDRTPLPNELPVKPGDNVVLFGPLRDDDLYPALVNGTPGLVPAPFVEPKTENPLRTPLLDALGHHLSPDRHAPPTRSTRPHASSQPPASLGPHPGSSKRAKALYNFDPKKVPPHLAPELPMMPFEAHDELYINMNGKRDDGYVMAFKPETGQTGLVPAAYIEQLDVDYRDDRHKPHHKSPDYQSMLGGVNRPPESQHTDPALPPPKSAGPSLQSLNDIHIPAESEEEEIRPVSTPSRRDDPTPRGEQFIPALTRDDVTQGTAPPPEKKSGFFLFANKKNYKDKYKPQ